MNESIFFIPNIHQDCQTQKVEPYLRNLQGVFSVNIDGINGIVRIRHSRSMQRRELSRTLSKLGFPEQVIV